MKTLHVIILLLFATATNLFAQQLKPRALTPSKGHYAGLQAFNLKPKSSNELVDQKKFPYDAASAERRLTLKPYYLQNTSLDQFNIPNPPTNSSEQTRAELNYLLQLQNRRTKLDVESSLYMAGVYYNLRVKPEDSTYSAYRRNLFHIGRSIGTWFNHENLPLTADFMAHVWQDASYFIWGFKYKFLRVRPYVLDSAINNLEETNWAAYPSGHAANSYVNAYIYQELAPEFAEQFITDAYEMAHTREILGVHYPSDSEASRQLARQLVNKLFENEKFRQDFEAVKKEWALKAKETFVKPQQVEKKGTAAPSSCAEKASECAKPAQEK